MKVVAIVEARLCSERLPGKVLLPIQGKPALECLLERLKRVKNIDEIVLATTKNPADSTLASLGRRLNIESYRGSEEDVMGRVLEAAQEAEADAIVEITGDCVLLSPKVLEDAIEEFKQGEVDILTNTRNGSYPQGVDVQIYSVPHLAEAYEKTQDAAHREHVSLYFYENADQYRIKDLEAPEGFRAPDYRFQLDYLEDYEFIRAVYGKLYPTNHHFDLPEIFELLNEKPGLVEINRHMEEKAVRS